ncbi:hypothetical protein [Vibrio phage vB_VpM-pA2SJ1]|uniref:Uncharacterized protein n=1 Tax=Vibrio phage vB_VpM-pA2SJ1 TaxID=3095964 RepID=A0AAX4J5H1_9CAUD
MVKLKDTPHGSLFWWKGKKWVSLIRPKNPINPNKYEIVCGEHPQGDWVNMPANRKVKPIIRIKNE